MIYVFRKVVMFCFVLVWLSGFQGVCQNKTQPNILFIMSDDHAAEAIGAYKSHLSDLNLTPNIDSLAKEGMLFSNVFCNNSICTPSRASILTGQYPQTNGVLGLDDSLPGDKQYLPIEMKKLGYSTAIIGKYHLKDEPTSFDYYKVLPGQGEYFNPQFREKGKGKWPNNSVSSEGHSSDVITDLSINYLEQRDQSKPFFLLHHYKAPHGPFSAALRYTNFLKHETIPAPSTLYPQPTFGSEATKGRNDSLIRFIGTSISNRHVFGGSKEPWNGNSEDDKKITHAAYQNYIKPYLRCVKGVDDNLGRLFDYLKKEGLWENTVIIYTSDQGMMLGAHDYTDKRWGYDESMRMPFIVHYPKWITEGRKSDLLVNNTDFAPTLIALAGGKAPEQMQGFSFVNTLKGKKEETWRDGTYYRYWRHLIGHFVPAHFAIRTKEYKLIFFYGAFHRPQNEHLNYYWGKRYSEFASTETPPAWEFYDLWKDPKEMINRYDDPAYSTIIKKLKLELIMQREQLNESDDKYPQLKEIIESNW